MPNCCNIKENGEECGNKCHFKYSIINDMGKIGFICSKCRITPEDKKLYHQIYSNTERGKEVQRIASTKYYAKKILHKIEGELE